MDRLQAMRMFTRVIDEGSFAAAARSINVSPAVVTRLIAELEEHLGARLINRTTRRLALTEAGEAYLERVRHILIELEDAEALASASTVEARGTLRVLCPPAFAVHQLAKHLPAFRARHPKVTVELTVEKVRGASVRFTYRVTKGEELLAEGFTEHACLGPGGRPARIPAEMRRMLEVV